jgi:hypothetical protein
MGKSLIISGFAGIGKTTLQKKYPETIIDLESSDFKWIYSEESLEETDKEKRKGTTKRTLNSEWPLNYVKAIVEASFKYDVVLISQDLDMRNCLRENGVEYAVCFPTKDCKEDFIKRYRDRGNNEAFISLVDSNFEAWIDALEKEENKILIQKGEYLEDTLLRYKLIYHPIINNAWYR